MWELKDRTSSTIMPRCVYSFTDSITVPCRVWREDTLSHFFEPAIFSRTDAFTLSGFKAALNEGNSTGRRVSYNHDGFNALTETEKWFPFISAVDASARALRRTPNVLSARANKVFKVTVSLMCDDRTSLDWEHGFKNVPVLWFCRSCPDFSGSFIYRYVFKQMF